MSTTFWQNVQEFFGHALGVSRPAGVGQPQPPSQDPLFQLLQEIDVELQQRLNEHSETPEEEKIRQEQLLQLEIEARQQELCQAILEMHQRFATGLALEELQRLSQMVGGHCKNFRSLHDGQLDHVAMVAVFARFHRESLQRGWNELQSLMEQHQVEWPPPRGLSPNADEQERSSARDFQLKKLEESFLASPLRRTAQLMLGIVPIWKAAYPEAGSSLWHETVLLGLGSALAVRHFEAIEKVASLHDQEIHARLRSFLQDPLEALQQRLRGGVGSISEARKLSDEAVRLCQVQAPEVVWHYLETLQT